MITAFLKVQIWLQYKALQLKNNLTFIGICFCQHCENETVTHENHLIDDDKKKKKKKNEKDIQDIIDRDYQEK